MKNINLRLCKVRCHLPNLELHISLDWSKAHVEILGCTHRVWNPLYVLDDARVVHVREDQLWRSVFVILSGLFHTYLILVPNIDLVVVWAWGQYVFVWGAPFQQGYLFAVMVEAMNSLLGHTEIPDHNLACWVTSYCEEVLVDGVELPNAQAVLRILVSHDKICGWPSQIPNFEVAIIWCRNQEVASMSFMRTELDIIYSFYMCILKRKRRRGRLLGVPNTNHLLGCRAKQALLVTVPAKSKAFVW